MAKEKSNSSFEIQTVKEIYSALNRNDVSTFLSFFDPKIKRFETFGGHYHGLDELKTNFSQGRETWAEGSCEPEEFTVADNKVVVLVHVKVRLKNKTEWIDGKVTDVFAFKSGKVVEFHSFDDRNEALKWAGAKSGGKP